MSNKHLSAGSEKPPMEDGKMRVYSMRFCPFVQRVHLVLNAKAIPHDVVYIDLKNKPEWFLKLHPDGKVPVLETGDQVIVESLDIVDFLDEKYPEPAMYPVPERKVADKELIEKFGKVVSANVRLIHDKESKSIQTFLDEILSTLEEFEEELSKRGTPFFSGDKPGMVDYMMWPWSERSKLPAILKNEELNFPKEKFPKLVAWRQAMQETGPVKETMIELDTHVRFVRGYLDSTNPDYLDDEF